VGPITEAFLRWLTQQPEGCRVNIAEAYVNGQSVTYEAFKAGYLAGLNAPDDEDEPVDA
jgi:hypothetical protein